MAQIPRTAHTLDAYQQQDPELVEFSTSAVTAIHSSLFDGEVLDSIIRGRAPGVRLLGITNRRLIMFESPTREDRLALTSLPLSGITAVSFVLGAGETIDTATTVVFRVSTVLFELTCGSREDAREAHDLVVWHLIT